jgi:S1-C subfamily serine protease
MPIDSPESLANPRIADYVWVTRAPEPPRRGRLGVMVRAVGNGKGLEVLAVAPESPAEQGGIQVGDAILIVNGVEVMSIEDLHEIIAEKRRLHEIVVRRGRQHIKIQVTIPPHRN